MAVAKSVPAYIAAAPRDARPQLSELRAIIRSALPKAEEFISYGMPFYKVQGARIGFAAFKNHIGLFGLASVMHDFERELDAYDTTAKGAIHFPIDQPLPATLIKKLVRARTKA